MDTFKPIPCAPRYEISEDGAIRGNTRNGLTYRKWDTSERYPRVSLCLPNGTVIYRRVHILVLEAFVGPRPKGMVARHIDDDPLNCRRSNLRWGTRAENTEDRHKNKGWGGGEANHCSKLTNAQVLEIRADPRYRWKPKEYAEKFGVSKACVVEARIGRTFKNLPA